MQTLLEGCNSSLGLIIPVLVIHNLSRQDEQDPVSGGDQKESYNFPVRVTIF